MSEYGNFNDSVLKLRLYWYIMTSLIIDTSGDQLRVVLADEGRVLGQKRWRSSPETGRLVLAATETLLSKAGVAAGDINRVAVHAGPGRYGSSLRAGVVAAQMLACAWGVDLVPLPGRQKVEAFVGLAEKLQPVKTIKVLYPPS